MRKAKNLPPPVWDLKSAMARRGIKTSIELHQRLVRNGASISERQVRRLVQTDDPTLSWSFLCHLLMVLQCDVAELIAQPKAPIAAPSAPGPSPSAEVTNAVGPPAKREGQGGRVRPPKTPKQSRSLFATAPAPAKNVLRFGAKRHV